MCVIFNLTSGQKIPSEYLHNAVYNNADGFGMLYNKSRTKKDFDWEEVRIEPKEGSNEVDPVEVEAVIKQYEKFDRWIHLRNATVGEVIPQNNQPIRLVHPKDPSKIIWIMHNGTMQKYKRYVSSTDPTKVSAGYNVNEFSKVSDLSDSYYFTHEFIKQFFEFSDDYHHPMAVKLIQDEIGIHGDNRVMIITNWDAPRLYNYTRWSSLKPLTHKLMGENDPEILASNDTYFKDVTRGGEFERRKKAQEERDAEEKRKNSTNLVAFQRNNAGSSNSSVERIKAKLLGATRDALVDLSTFFESVHHSKKGIDEVLFDNSKESLDMFESVLNTMYYSDMAEMNNWVKNHPEDATIFLMRLVSETVKYIEQAQEDAEDDEVVYSVN